MPGAAQRQTFLVMIAQASFSRKRGFENKDHQTRIIKQDSYTHVQLQLIFVIDLW